MLVCVSMFLNLKHVQTVDVDILQPINTQPGPEVVVIMIPGSLVPGEGYSNLGQALQVSSSFKLWVALTKDYTFNIPLYPEVEEAVDMAFKALESQGASVDRAFLAGHSLGGIVGQDYAHVNKKRFEGVLLFASFLPIWQPVATYPLPVLTISGDLDGLVRISRLLNTFTDVSELSFLNIFSKPVVIVPGLNHGQFINPESLSGRVRALDIQTDVDSSVTLGEVSRFVNWFMPLKNIRALDQNEDGVSQWSIRAQELAAGIDREANPEIKIQNKVISREPFLSEDALDRDDDGTVKVKTFTYQPFEVNTLDRASIPQSAREMMVKMVSQDSILEILPNAQLLPPLTCRQINEEALKLVLSEISQTALERWETRSRKITFIDDIVERFQDDWFNNALSLKDPGQNGGLDVTSVSWATAAGTWPFQVAGVQYCKLISPYRIAEWVYVESLRDTEHLD